MSQDVWKEFEENQITHSAAHYLMAIKQLLEDHGYARVTDIAKSLNITRGSCSISLKPLKKRGLVVEDENRFLKLSDEGQRLAELVELNDKLLELLFGEVLGVDQDQAEIDACKIEHLLSIEVSTRLSAFVKVWQSDAPEVDAFKKLLKKSRHQCAGDSKQCDICNGLCIQPQSEQTTDKRLEI
ncbi:metal-dependent transcriptional regulator [Kiritimatiellaeota bacterium B1221]|nr:metal-dependent transcriptional regulator [Kiritimatiellaeota bacterium B1221]